MSRRQFRISTLAPIGTPTAASVAFGKMKTRDGLFFVLVTPNADDHRRFQPSAPRSRGSN